MQKQIRKNALKIQDQLMDKFIDAYNNINYVLYLYDWEDFTLEDYDELFEPFLKSGIKRVRDFARSYRDNFLVGREPLLNDEEEYNEYIRGSLETIFNWTCDYIEETFA